jgi:hypothetical protein
MFKSLFRLVQLSLLLSGWGLAALSLHVVRTPDKIGLIPKERLGITDTYVDARTWTLSDLSSHSALIQRVLEADKADLFRYLADPAKGDVAGQLSGAIQQAPASQKASFFGLPVKSEEVKAGFDSVSLPIDY